MTEQFAPAWSDAQDRAYDLRAEYDEAMTAARSAWIGLSAEERADPLVAHRYTLIKQALASGYRRQHQETMAELSPPP